MIKTIYVGTNPIEFNSDSLEDVNKIRTMKGFNILASLNGYCYSSGCSCGQGKGTPECGNFKAYEKDGAKRDFLNEFFGI